MRKLAWALIVVVGLVGLAGAVDAYARSTAEHRIAAGIGATVGRAEVVVEGAFFLPQLLAGEFDHLEIVIPDLALQGVRLEEAEVSARGVATAAPHTIRSLAATATVPISEIDRLFAEVSGLNADIVVRGESLALTSAVLGQELALVVQPVLADGDLTLVPLELTLGGIALDLAQLHVVDGLAGEVTLPLGLPEGMRLTGVEVLPQGVRLRVEGTAVPADEVT